MSPNHRCYYTDNSSCVFPQKISIRPPDIVGSTEKCDAKTTLQTLCVMKINTYMSKDDVDPAAKNSLF